VGEDYLITSTLEWLPGDPSTIRATW